MYGCLSTQIKINRRAKSWQKGEIVATGGKLKKKNFTKKSTTIKQINIVLIYSH